MVWAKGLGVTTYHSQSSATTAATILRRVVLAATSTAENYPVKA